MALRRPPLWVLGAAALLGGLTFWLFAWHARSSDVHVVNGLSAPVEVAFGTQRVTVPANDRRVLRSVASGTYRAVVQTDKGVAVESSLVGVEGGERTVIFNVAGAAPVMWRSIDYRAGPDQIPPFSVYCGSELITLEDVDLPFKELPRVVSSKGRQVRSQVLVANGGLSSCFGEAMHRGRFERMGEWSSLHARLQGYKAGAPGRESITSDDWFRMDRELAAVSRTSLEHRIKRQRFLLATGRYDEAFAEAKARDVPSPTATAEDALLRLMLVPEAEQADELARARTAFANAPLLDFFEAGLAFRQGDYPRAFALYTAASQSLPAGLLLEATEARMRLALHLRKPKDALEIATRFSKEHPDIKPDTLNFTRATVAATRASGAKVDWTRFNEHDERWIRVFFEPSQASGVELAALQPRKTEAAGYVEARRLTRYGLSEPTRALQTAGTGNEAALLIAPQETLVLLLTEAWRVKDTAAIARLETAVQRSLWVSPSALRQFVVTGQKPPQLQLDDLSLAAAWLGRARFLEAAGQSSSEARAQVVRYDNIEGAAAQAAQNWPPALGKDGVTGFAWVAE